MRDPSKGLGNKLKFQVESRLRLTLGRTLASLRGRRTQDLKEKEEEEATLTDDLHSSSALGPCIHSYYRLVSLTHLTDEDIEALKGE